MIVEGTLAETGYHAYHAMLERNDLLPALREGIGLLRRDESRHIAYGLHLLSRHLAADPRLWDVLRHRMEGLLEPALGVIHELCRGAFHDEGWMPGGGGYLTGIGARACGGSAKGRVMRERRGVEGGTTGER